MLGRGIGVTIQDVSRTALYRIALPLTIMTLFLALVGSAWAQDIPTEDTYDQIMVNSEDWQDVYSGVMYGNHLGKTSKFLVSTRHTTLILNEIPVGSDLLVLSSADLPFGVGYESLLQVRGYPAQEVFFDRGEMNLALAEALTEVNRYVVVDPSYGYNAMSVAPYAMLTEAFVLLVREENIDDVVDFLNGKDPESVLIYGTVDREVTEGLAPFDPDTINFDGDRYLNNIEIVRRYLEISPTKQVTFSNGEFIEQELMTNRQPVVFIGTGNVPDSIQEFLSEAQIEVGVLIGNQYVSSATTIRRQTGVNVFVKFARGARNPSGPIAQVEGLDLFYLPSYNPLISIFSMVYNQLSNTLEVTIRNEVDQATYFRGTYTLSDDSGVTDRPGDQDAIFLGGNKYKTIIYDVGALTGEIRADAFILFGESPSSLDYLLEQSNILVQKTDILDNSELEIIEAYYDAVNDRFVIVLQNTGSVEVFADAEIFDLVIAGDDVQISAEEVIRIKPGEEKNIYVPAVLAEEDYEDNDFVNIRIFYGQREEHLIKTLVGRLELNVRSIDYLMIGLVTVTVILVFFLFFLLFRRKKREDERRRRKMRWRDSPLRRLGK